MRHGDLNILREPGCMPMNSFASRAEGPRERISLDWEANYTC
jgi:hypothetical protein